MSNETESKAKPAQTLVAFASSWGSKFGGINSFNTDLLSALGITFYRDVRVICVVLDAVLEDIQRANNDHVEVLSLNRPNDHDFRDDFLPLVKDELDKIGCCANTETVWLGHDRITGDIALKAAKDIGGRSALIHHMSYAHYEAYAAGAQKADEKEAKQRALFTHADVIFAVGPLLHDALEDLTGKKAVMLVPGLPEIIVSEASRTFTGFLSGRIDAATLKIKQAHLGIASFANAVSLSNSNPVLPVVLNFKNNPCLKIRGLSSEGVRGTVGVDAETELSQLAEDYAGGVINLRALPFSTDKAAIFNELRKSSVALMPSWHEGFGLGFFAVFSGMRIW